MAAVAFDYALWAAMFPELAASVSAPLAQSFWSRAGLQVDNTACSPITDDTPGGIRATILNLITAHIAALNAAINGQAPSGIVGRISSATQGSVSVQTQMTVQAGTAEWYAQTRYGMEAWTALASYRSAHYVAGPARQMNPWQAGFPGYPNYTGQ